LHAGYYSVLKQRDGLKKHRYNRQNGFTLL